MRGRPTREVLRHLRTLYQCGVTAQLSDEELLELFLAQRDHAAQEAFAAIVHRHGPMVLGVCLRVLGNAHDAEDAFQATFLVLARKAAAVIRRERVANWLYGVACRTAKEARGRAARRRAREERVSLLPPNEADGDSAEELRRIVDEELAKLPARYRAPVVLCELEGLSRRDAARQLDIPEGTLSSRLARAKSQLRDRLARRGLSVPVVALAAVLGRQANAAGLSDLLIDSTASAAMRVAVGSSTAAVVSASVASLTEGVLKAMLLAKLKGVVLGTGTLVLVVSGAVVLAQSGPKPAGPGPSQPDRAAAMEKKLDRILDALDRLAPIAPPATTRDPYLGTQARSSPGIHAGDQPANPAADPEIEAGRWNNRQNPQGEATVRFDLAEGRNAFARGGHDDAAVAASAAPAVTARPQSGKVSSSVLADTHALPLADRMEQVEQLVRNAVSRLEQIERRLTELERRVGGTGGPPRKESNNPTSPFGNAKK
jgi:RNA polymerase sigma factor (sigma-70 family)